VWRRTETLSARLGSLADRLAASLEGPGPDCQCGTQTSEGGAAEEGDPGQAVCCEVPGVSWRRYDAGQRQAAKHQQGETRTPAG